MAALPKAASSRERAAALIIVLAFVVLLTGLVLAYLSRATSDRPVAHSSFNQSRADQLAASAMDLVIGDLRAEIADPNFSTATTVGSSTIYTPKAPANMLPMRSGNPTGNPDPIPNLVRISWAGDTNLNPRSGASAVTSEPVDSANPKRGDITRARWNKHYLVPKLNTGDDKTDPIAPFTAPDWVFLTSAGPTRSPAPAAVIGRYAYAIYDEGGLLDMNIAGYPTNTAPIQSGRKGSLAFAELRALGPYPILNPNGSGDYQIDRLVGWRNYATTQPTNTFPDITPQAFAKNFQTSTTPATNFYNYVINNTNGFLSTSGATWAPSSNALRTDQGFVNRQELIAFQKTQNTNNGDPIPNTSQFDPNALQYLGTFSRETNSPSFSPSTPTAINPNFLLALVTTSFTRFDGTTAAADEPLVKTRFPLSRLAWITYKGPSASLASTDPVYTQLIAAGVTTATIQAGTAANLTKCFGLTFGGTTGAPWTYSHGATARILRLDEVAAAKREPDFFELLQAAILDGSLGQSTSGGVTGGSVFPDIHMSSTTQHILSIGAAIIDQADIDSIPTRIQFTGTNGNTWAAYGVENLPYITQLYPVAGKSPNDSIKWATYLLFQLWNPHQNAPASLQNNVRLRVDGGIGLFTGGNGQTWSPSNTPFVANGASAGQSVTLKSTASFSAPAPLATDNASTTSTAQGTFAFLPAPPAVPTPTP
jgi:Tfp pilus assembly protein PilX